MSHIPLSFVRRFLVGGIFIFMISPGFSQPVEPSQNASPSPSPSPSPDSIIPPLPTPASIPSPSPLSLSEPGTALDMKPLPSPSPFVSPSTSDTTTDFLTPLMKSKLNLSDFPSSASSSTSTASADMMTFQKIEEATLKEFYNPKVSNLTIDDAIQLALKRNPDLLNSIQQIRLTRGQVIEIRALALPQISLKSSYGQSQDSLVNPHGSGERVSTLNLVAPDGTPLTGTLTSQGSTINDKSWNVTFQATQMIFNGAVIAGTQAAKFVEDASYFSLRQKVDQVIAEVKIQFFRVILNRTLIVAQEQNIALLSQQLQDQENRYEAGTVPRFNVLQAEVALANARPNLIKARNDYRVAQYQLVKLLGVEPSAENPNEVPFNVVGDLSYSLRKIDADKSIRLAIQRSPFLKAQRQNVLAQSKNLEAALSGYLPTIQAQANYMFQNDSTSKDLGETIQGWFWGVTGNWNIFDGLATYGASEQAKAQLYQSKNTYDNSVSQVILDVQQSISNLQEARETIESQEASVTQATEALRLSKERLDAGAGTQLDVLNAQVQLLTAQTTVLQARFDYIQSLARYDQWLSLDTKYNETFADPLTRIEKSRYQTKNEADRPQPNLPKRFQNQDPIAGMTPEPLVIKHNPPRTKQAPKPKNKKP